MAKHLRLCYAEINMYIIILNLFVITRVKIKFLPIFSMEYYMSVKFAQVIVINRK